MNSDEMSRSTGYSSNRKSNTQKTQAYSPSTNYNYGNQSSHGSHGNHGNSGFGNQQHQRRKPGQFKRDNHGGGSDRIAKQNDVIIRLLKEIRDRLPAPAVVPEEVGEGQEQGFTEESGSDINTEELAQQEALTPQETAVAAGEPDLDEEFDEEVNGNV